MCKETVLHEAGLELTSSPCHSASPASAAVQLRLLLVSKPECMCCRYMPAYKAYLPGLYRDGPKAKSQGGPLLVVEVDKIRGLAGQQPQPKRQIVNAACLLLTVIFLWSQLSVSA